MEDLFPQMYGKHLGEKGKWIMVTHTPCTEYSVPPLSIWYAIPGEIRSRRVFPITAELELYGKPSVEDILLEVAPKVAKIITPKGELSLFPHEYKLIDMTLITQFADGEHIKVHYLDKNAAPSSDALFYLRSRGIGKAEAINMLLHLIEDEKMRHYCYFTFHDEYIKQLLPDEYKHHQAQKKEKKYGIEGVDLTTPKESEIAV